MAAGGLEMAAGSLEWQQAGLQLQQALLAAAAAHPSQSAGRAATSEMLPGPVDTSLLASTLQRFSGEAICETRGTLVRGHSRPEGVAAAAVHTHTPALPNSAIVHSLDWGRHRSGQQPLSGCRQGRRRRPLPRRPPRRVRAAAGRRSWVLRLGGCCCLVDARDEAEGRGAAVCAGLIYGHIHVAGMLHRGRWEHKLMRN